MSMCEVDYFHILPFEGWNIQIHPRFRTISKLELSSSDKHRKTKVGCYHCYYCITFVTYHTQPYSWNALSMVLLILPSGSNSFGPEFLCSFWGFPLGIFSVFLPLWAKAELLRWMTGAWCWTLPTTYSSIHGKAMRPSCRALGLVKTLRFLFKFLTLYFSLIFFLPILQSIWYLIFDICWYLTFLLATFAKLLAAQEGILDKEDVVNENIKLFETKFHSFRRPKHHGLQRWRWWRWRLGKWRREWMEQLGWRLQWLQRWKRRGQRRWKRRWLW